MTMSHNKRIATTLFRTLLIGILLIQHTALQAHTLVAERDTTTLLPPDTAAVVVGFDGDEAFGVTPQTATQDATHRVRPAEWIVPSAVAVGGALCVKSAWGKRFRNWARDDISQKGKHTTSADEYLQFVPLVAGYGLDFCGVKAQHGFVDRTILVAMSAVTVTAATYAAKQIFKEKRPDSDERNSFPSGHTARTFMGAELLWQEYRHTQPWIGYTGYAVAAAVAYLRMYNDRHWANDVLAGAAIGMLSTKFAYWLYPKIFKEHTRKNRTTAFGMPYYNASGAGVSLAVVF